MLKRIASLLRFSPPAVGNEGLLFASGTTVPADGTYGYQVGCIFQKTNGGAETALYVNEGSVSSADFNPITTGSSELADLADVGALAYTAGDILVADGDSYEEVAVSGDVTITSAGVASLNAVHGEETAYIVCEALAAGADLAVATKFAHSRAVTLSSVVVIFEDSAIGTINDANTSVFAVTDGAGNSIVTKTYNTATQPTAPGVNDLGALNGTNKVLTADETVRLAVTNGATAATPRFVLRLTYVPTNV